MDEAAPAMRAVLERLAAQRAGQPSRYGLPFAEARELLAREREPWLADGPACPFVQTTIHEDGRTVALRAYRPDVADAGRILVYLHGGGWCVGSPATHDNIVRRLAVGLGCEAWSVDYALAPEAPFPSGLLDAIAAIRAAARQHPGARLVVAGDSAGANLALDAALKLRSDASVRIEGLLLFYGVYTDALDDPSMTAHGDGRWGLSRQAHERYLAAYRGGFPRSRGRPEASPDGFGASRGECAGPSNAGLIFALDPRVDLRGLPPTRLTIAELDILRDQSHALATKLEAAGVDVAVDEVAGVIHGFLSYGLALPQARTALEAACAWIREGP